MNVLGIELIVSGQTLTKACPLVTGTVPGNSSSFCSSISVYLVKSSLCVQYPLHWRLSPELTILKYHLLKRQLVKKLGIACSDGRGAAVLAPSADNLCLFALGSGKTLAVQ